MRLTIFSSRLARPEATESRDIGHNMACEAWLGQLERFLALANDVRTTGRR